MEQAYHHLMNGPGATSTDAELRLSDVFQPQEIEKINDLWKQKTKGVLRLDPSEINNHIDTIYGQLGANAREEKILHLVLGPPGAGKSSILVDPLAEKYGAMVVDSDAIKKQLPGFNKGFGDDYVHPASSKIASGVMVRALENGKNIVHPIVGAKPEKVTDMIDIAKENGYKVGLHLAEVSPELSARRTYNRLFKVDADGNRQMVPPELALSTGTRPTTNFNQIIDNGTPNGTLVDKFTHYNNDVPYGSPPITVRQGGGIQTPPTSP